MASSSKLEREYDVFLSFRGMDLRNNFVSHLYQALYQSGIYTFRDSEGLRKGDKILPALMKAIEESRIAIIIFSEDYVSSTWCLEEVAKIMECKEKRDLMVFSVFYKMEPKEVRTPREKYKEAMLKHESKFGKDSEEVKRWKKALSDAGSLSGWHLKDVDESELIQRIVKEISTYIARTPLDVARYPVGIDSRLVKLKSMLNLESDDGVLMVGLWGQGGIGKTTLAKALYNAIVRQFEGSCFLAEVRETSRDCRGLVTLQEKLLKDVLLLQQRLEVSSEDGGINLIQHMLHCKKVLLILDDVDDYRQIYALAGEGKCFGKGSRIIVTTRDSHLLTYLGIDQDHVYKVIELNDSEAHELLSKHVFPTHQNLKIKKNLVDSVLNHAKGLPLALVVMGSFLRGRREREWESTLRKLSKICDKTIYNVLKISYDGLELNEKEIFLHIICFFKGWLRGNIKKVLDSCDFEATIGLKILIERSLISIERSGFLKVHDLIRAMGIEIVNQECRDDPGRRSRLWLYDDVVDVLSRDMGGDCAVKAIMLAPREWKELRIHPNALTKMRKLRLLSLCNVYNSFQGPICLPNELRWIKWAEDLGIPEFSSGPKKLVGLDISGSSVPIVVKQFKDFQQLKYIKLSICDSLVITPNLSYTPNLEELNIENCHNLVEAHESVAYHDKLHVLQLRWCSKLGVFPNVLKSKNLRSLHLDYCPKFERFPDIPQKLENLKELSLQATAIKELPASIENLTSIKKMDIYRCNNLVSLPSNIYKLQNMKKMDITFCTSLIGMPKYEAASSQMNIGLSNLQNLSLVDCNLSEIEFLEDLSSFPFLRELDLSKNNITRLPTSISKCDHLSILRIEDCHQLQEIPELPLLLNILEAQGCKSLQTNGHLTSIDQWVRRGLTMVDTASLAQDSYLSFELPGGEMPEWFQPVEEDSISFMASKNLYDKFMGLALCVVLRKDEFDMLSSFEIEARINGERRYLVQHVYRQSLNIVFLQYYTPFYLWRAVDFGQIDGSYAHFSLAQLMGGVKKWGFRIICKQLEDDLKVEIRDNQLIDPAFLHEVDYDSIDSKAKSSHTHEDLIDLAFLHKVDHNSTDSEAKSSNMHEDSPMEIDLLKNFQNRQMSTGKHIKIGSKRKHELTLPQGWLHL